MYRPLLVMATGAVLAIAAAMSVQDASAHERCVCTSAMAVPPVPSVAPLPPMPPLPPIDGRRRVETKVIIIGPDGAHHVRHIRRVVRIEEHGDGDRMTRDAFIKRAERAFDEHDRNHDGVLDDNERDDLSDSDDDSEEVDVPEAPEAPEAPDADEAPEPPTPPHAPHAPHAPHH